MSKDHYIKQYCDPPPLYSIVCLLLHSLCNIWMVAMSTASAAFAARIWTIRDRKGKSECYVAYEDEA